MFKKPKSRDHTLECSHITDRNFLISVDGEPPIMIDYGTTLHIHDAHYDSPFAVFERNKVLLREDIYEFRLLSLRPESNAAVMKVGDKTIVLSSTEPFILSKDWFEKPHKAFKESYDYHRTFEKASTTWRTNRISQV